MESETVSLKLEELWKELLIHGILEREKCFMLEPVNCNVCIKEWKWEY